MNWVKCGAVLIGGASGAAFAILSIELFNSNDQQLGYAAACAIFGGIMCAVTSISDGIPRNARKSAQSDLSANSTDDGRPKRQLAPPRFTTAISTVSCTTCAGAIGRLARTQGADSHHAPLSIRDPGREGVFRRHPGRKGQAGHAQAGPPHPLRARRRISTPRSLWTPIRKPLSLCSRRSRLACRYRACNAAAARNVANLMDVLRRSIAEKKAASTPPPKERASAD